MDKKRTRSIPDILENGENGEQYLIRRKIVKTKFVDKSGEIQDVEKINEIKYRIDAAFMPEHPEEICEEYMRNFVKAKGVDAVKWYMALWDKEIPGKGKNAGKSHKITLREITNEFISNEKFGLNGAVELLARKSKKSVVKEDLEAWLAANSKAKK